MRLCMFRPAGQPMERGWVGRIDGERVIHLAAQTLQSFFTGGGSAREHAEYRLSEVELLAPVLHPPSIRVFEDDASFAFANPAAVRGPGAEIEARSALSLVPRVAGIVGAGGALGAFTILAEWRDPTRERPKDRDFALGTGPVAVTPDSFDPRSATFVVRVGGSERARETIAPFDWDAAVAIASDRTRLHPGDLLAVPGGALVEGLEARDAVEIDVDGIGVLEHVVV